jgi:pimeloyl-ACP methyl ester carboxylesterase
MVGVPAAVALLAQIAGASSGTSPPQVLGRGKLALARCGSAPTVYCGGLLVPLDYASPSGPRIRVAFRFYPARDGDARGTVLPIQGGPGFSSIGSSGGYADMYGPLLDHFNMLLVDDRGTGSSTPIDCPRLQNLPASATASQFQAAAGACGRALDRRWRYPDGGWVHASDLFSSIPTAEDLAAVVRGLDLGRVDLYGDSYGTYLAQVFAGRYPSLLRSVVLDSAYQTRALDPWYRSTVTGMPAAFDEVCQRSPACRDAAPGPAGRLGAGPSR